MLNSRSPSRYPFFLKTRAIRRLRYAVCALLALFVLGACEDVVQERDPIQFGDASPPQDVRRDLTNPDIPPGDVIPDQPPPDVQPDIQPDVPPDMPPPDVPPDFPPPPDLIDVPIDMPPVECRDDGDCFQFDRPFCDPITDRCVQCTADSQCPGQQRCQQNTCVGGMGPPCFFDQECPGFPDQVCNNYVDPFSQGRCVTSCLPWSDADPSCAPGEWCRASFFTPGVGGCVPDNDFGIPDGGFCMAAFGFEQAGCQAGSLCLPQFSGDTVCSSLCEVGTGEGCNGMQQACVQLVFDDAGMPVETAYGTCAPGCDFDAGLPCLDPTLICGRGEIFQTADDICFDGIELDPLEECAPVGLQEGELCGGSAACFDLMAGGNLSGRRCYDLCVGTAQNPIGTFNHPDCRTDNTFCEAAFQGQDLGLCVPQNP